MIGLPYYEIPYEDLKGIRVAILGINDLELKQKMTHLLIAYQAQWAYLANVDVERYNELWKTSRESGALNQEVKPVE